MGIRTMQLNVADWSVSYLSVPLSIGLSKALVGSLKPWAFSFYNIVLSLFLINQVKSYRERN